MIGVVVAYALSPIDLIPDFIPLVGYLDDLLLLPLGIWLAIHLIPPAIWRDVLAEARAQPSQPPRNRTAAVLIVLLWFIAAATLLYWALPLMRGINKI